MIGCKDNSDGKRSGEGTSYVDRWIHSQLFEQVPCAIALIDRHFIITANNPFFTKTFGDGRGEVCYWVYKQRSEPCPQCMAVKTFLDGLTYVNEDVGIDNNGLEANYIVQFSPLRDEHGEVTHVIEMSTNITGLRQLKRKYKSLFEHVPCYISVLDRSLKIVRANKLMRRTFGAEKGKYCYDVYKQSSTQCRDCPAERTFADERVHRSTQSWISREGEKIFVVETAPLNHNGGPLSHVIEMAVDVTRIKQLEQEKIEAERLAAVGQTVAGLAHGIKNILTGLEGGLYVMQTGREKGLNERVELGWEMLNRNIVRTSSLVQNLLTFSKGTEPCIEMIRPDQLVEEVVELFRGNAQRDNITLETQIQADMTEAPMDPEGIHICLTNLLSNAIDACQLADAMQVTVTIRCYESQDGAIVLEVEDQGCGMDYEVKQKVFTNFFTTKGTGGTGIGLLQTRKIVQQHGGTVDVWSTPGEGATFRLTFPRSRLPRAPKEERVHEESGSGVDARDIWSADQGGE